MTVYFIGAGPGAADLVTLRAQRIISEAPVCLYAGALVPDEVLTWCPADADRVDTQHLTLPEIIERLTAAHAAGQDVARLHSGDPSLFSAVAEQIRQLDDRQIPSVIVPGVAAWSAAAAALHRELTVPEVSQSVVLTRISRRASAMPVGESLTNFGETGATLVIHLAVQAIAEVVAELLPSRGEDCPVAVCAHVSQPQELILRGTLATIADQVALAGVRRTAVIIVGDVLTAKGFRDSHLYSCDRERSVDSATA